jgi:hypothetical protein
MKSYFESTFNSADATTAATVRAAETDLRSYITDIVLSVGTTMAVSILDSDNNIVVSPSYISANTTVPISLKSPIPLTEAKGIKVKASTSGNISVTITGYSED